MNQYRCKIIKRCFDCSCCKENLLPPKPFQIWMCCQGSNQPCRPLDAPGCEDGIPDWCPLPYQSEQDIKELFRKEIAKWKDEDPLFMAYVYGQEAGRKDEREKVLDELHKKARSQANSTTKSSSQVYKMVKGWIEELRQKAGEQ